MPNISYLCSRFSESMSNGVMVAQQVLVLFVVVRIRLGQQKESDFQMGHSLFV